MDLEFRKEILAEAERIDKLEDELYGENKCGNELPIELSTKQGRLKKMREAKEAIEREAIEKAQVGKTKDKTELIKNDNNDNDEVELTEYETDEIIESINPKTQRNFTDPESKIMKTNNGFKYAH